MVHKRHRSLAGQRGQPRSERRLRRRAADAKAARQGGGEPADRRAGGRDTLAGLNAQAGGALSQGRVCRRGGRHDGWIGGGTTLSPRNAGVCGYVTSWSASCKNVPKPGRGTSGRRDPGGATAIGANKPKPAILPGTGRPDACTFFPQWRQDFLARAAIPNRMQVRSSMHTAPPGQRPGRCNPR